MPELTCSQRPRTTARSYGSEGMSFMNSSPMGVRENL
jgi:hypothetical protein